MVNFVFTSVGVAGVGARGTEPPSSGDAIKIGGVHVLADELGNAAVFGAMLDCDWHRRRGIAAIADIGRFIVAMQKEGARRTANNARCGYYGASQH